MEWPDNKKFAFTIIDDTDNSTIENISAVYDLLDKHKFKTTKTVWVYPPRDSYKGQSLSDKNYLNFILDLKQKGFEIALHSVGSGKFTREETLEGLETYKKQLGSYPNIQINHADNTDSIFWGYKRFVPPLKWIYKLLANEHSSGDEATSKYYWGDTAKKHIKYFRNRVFNGINTDSYDKYQPYLEASKSHASNFWFSSSEGGTVEEFNALTSSINVDKLEQEGGLCILYTHFAKGFVNKEGELNQQFIDNIQYLSQKNGWFVTASEMLDYLLEECDRGKKISYFQLLKLDINWLVDRIVKKIKFRR